MRLIDADELIKRIGEWMPQGPGEIKQTVEERVATDMAASMYMEIEETPTAFDKEKVIDELKSAENYLYVNGARITNFKFIHPLTAIEIVEKGGIE